MQAPAMIALALWLLMVFQILFLTFNDPHSTPSLEMLIPRSDPLTWIVPAVVVGPPLLLTIALRAPARLASWLAWSVVAALVGVFVAFFLAVGLGL